MREVEVFPCVVEGLGVGASQQHLAVDVTWADKMQLLELAFLQDPRINDQVPMKPITSP